MSTGPLAPPEDQFKGLPAWLRWLFISMLAAAIVGPIASWPSFRSLFLFRILFVVFWILLAPWAFLNRKVLLRGLRERLRVRRYLCFFAVWMAWMGLSLLWAADKRAGLRYVIFLFMMMTLSVGAVIALVNTEMLKRALAVLSLVFCLAIGLGWLEILADFRLPLSSLVVAPERCQWASTSFFHNQNDFATYIMLWVPFPLLALFFLKRSNIAFTVLLLVAIALSSVCIVFTGSRIAVLASVVEIGSLLLLFGLKSLLKNLRAIAGVLVLLLPLAVSLSPWNGPVFPELAYRHLSMDSVIWEIAVTEKAISENDVTQDIGSLGRRVVLVRNGLRTLAASHLIGVGAGNADYHLSRMPGTEQVYNLHNWWMEILVNGGMLLFILYVGFYLLLLRDLFRDARDTQDGFLSYVSSSLFVALSGYLLGCLGPSSVIHFAPMWVVFGLALAGVNIYRKGVDLGREAAKAQ